MIQKQGNKIWDKSSQKKGKQATLIDTAEKKRLVKDAIRVVRAHQYKRIMEYHGGNNKAIVQYLEGEAQVLVKWKTDIDNLTTKYENEIAIDTIDIMDVWAAYFQEGESSIMAEIALDAIIGGSEEAPDVMADMSWLLWIPKGDVESTLESGSSEAGAWLGNETESETRMTRFLRIRDGPPSGSDS